MNSVWASTTLRKNFVSLSAKISNLCWPVACVKSLFPSPVKVMVNPGASWYSPTYRSRTVSARVMLLLQ
jgi:hypothetical protein